MLSEWLGSTTREEFDRVHFQRAPLAMPGTAAGAAPLFTWDTLERVFRADPAPDTLVVQKSRLLHDGSPAGLPDPAVLLRSGCSLVLRHVEHCDDGLRRLAEAFGRELEGDVTVHLFATPAGTHGFGWHYDCEDVFIAQTAGQKEYFLRENTVNPQPTIATMPRDMQYEKERSPVIASTLLAGDWIYVPRGWWHVARAAELSLSISVGVLSPAAGGTRR